MNDCDSFRSLKKGHIVGEADAIEEHSILDDSSEIDRCLSDNTSIDRSLSDNDDKPSPCPSQPVSSNPDGRLSSDINNLERCLSDELLQDVNAIPKPKIQQVSSVSSLDEVELQVPAHVRDLWRRSIDNLSFEESKILASTLTEYADIFSKDDMDLGCFSETEHHIDTGTTKPIRQGMRRTPMAFQDEEKKHLDSLLEINVIQPSFSDWASPPVLVRKKMEKFATALIIAS